jgi:hypothetical protein
VRERTTWRVIAVGRTYGEVYDFYSVSPEYFGCHHVVTWCLRCTVAWYCNFVIPFTISVVITFT